MTVVCQVSRQQSPSLLLAHFLQTVFEATYVALLVWTNNGVYRCPPTSSGGTPSPYEQLRDRLLSGKETVSISDLKKCTQKSGTIITNIRSVGGFWIDAFQILPEPNAHIAYADEHFTVTPDGAPVIEFLQYRVASNNIGTLTVRRLSPVTYKPLSEPIVFECQIGDGLRFLPEEGLLPAN